MSSNSEFWRLLLWNLASLTFAAEGGMCTLVGHPPLSWIAA